MAKTMPSGGLAGLADINELLNNLPAELAETLLTAFINELFKPPVDATVTA